MDIVERTVELSVNEVLKRAGEFGLFQKLVDAIFCIVYILVSYQILIMYFCTLTPSWHCAANSSSYCPFNGTQSSDNLGRCKIEKKYWYYVEQKHFSLVTEFDLDCGKKWVLELLLSIHFVGWAFGAITLGIVGDKYGRKVLLFPSIAVLLIGGCVLSFLPNVYVIIVIRFIIGFFIPGAMVQANILISEIVGDTKRPLAALIPFFSFPIGYSMLSVKSYFLNSWKLLSIVCTVPYVFVFVFYPFVPRSFKWLHSHGRSTEAIAVLRKIAKWNKKTLDANIVLATITTNNLELSDMKNSSSVERSQNRESNIILQTAIQCVLWIACTMCFFGLQMAAKELQGSLYVNFIILSLVQAPAIVVTIVAANKFGRKKTNLVPILIAGVICFGIAFIPAKQDFAVARVTMGVIGKFFTCVTFQGMYLWSVEIVPTHMRSKLIGVVQIAARIGATSAPWVLKSLAEFGMSVPFIVLGIPALLGAILGIWLPETKVVSNNEEKDCETSR